MQGGRDVRGDGVSGFVPCSAIEEAGGAEVGGGAFAEVQHGRAGGGIFFPEDVGFGDEFFERGIAGAPRGEERGGLARRALVGGSVEREESGVVDRGGAGIGRGRERKAATAEHAVMAALFVATVMIPEKKFEFRTGGEREGFGELDDGDGVGIAAAGAAVGAPSGVVAAVDQEGDGPEGAALFLVEDSVPLALEGAGGFGEIGGGVLQGDFFPRGAVGELGSDLEFGEGPRAVEAPTGPAERHIVVAQCFEAEAGGPGEIGGGDNKNIALGAGLALGDDRAVGELHGVVETAGAAHFGGDEGRPRDGGAIGADLVFPGGEFFRPRWFSFFQAVVDGPQIALEFGDLLLLLGSVDPRLGFVGVVEKSKNTEVVVVGDGIEFMRVALGALEGEAESGFADAVETVDDGLDAKLLRDNGALLVDHAVAEKTGGDDLILGGLGQEVAGDLLDEKLVVGLIPIQGVNDPVAPGPLFAREIFFEAVAVGVAGGVEPDAGPFLAVALACEELSDEGFDGWRETFHGGGGGEGSDVGGRGWEAGEVEEEAAAERGGIGGRGGGEAGGGEFRGDEGVDGLGCVKRG